MTCRYRAIFSEEQVIIQATIKPERFLEVMTERFWLDGPCLTLLTLHRSVPVAHAHAF
jgi:hypothetical protein